MTLFKDGVTKTRPIAKALRRQRAATAFRTPEPNEGQQLTQTNAGALKRINNGLQQFENLAITSNDENNPVFCIPDDFPGKLKRMNAGIPDHFFKAREDIFARHGVMFKKLLHNLGKPIQMELREFLTAEIMRNPLKLLPLTDYEGRQLAKVTQYNEMMRLNYERSICIRFLFEQKNKFSNNIEVALFYKFLVAGSIGKRLKCDILTKEKRK